MKNFSIQNVPGYLTAIIVHLIPISLFAFSLYMSNLLGGILQNSLGLDNNSVLINKTLSIVSMLCLFAGGFMRAKYKLEGLIDEKERKNLIMFYIIPVLVFLFMVYQFSISCGWLSNLKLGSYTIKLLPVKKYTEIGYNFHIIIAAIILTPFIEFVSGLMSLTHLVIVYPELKGKKAGTTPTATPEEQINEITSEFTDARTTFFALGTIDQSNKFTATAIKSQLEQLKNKIITVKGLPNIDTATKQTCTRLSTEIASLVNEINSKINAIPNT